MLKACFIFLSAGVLHAAEPESAADWSDRLAEVYRKQGGYIITYHSEGENKSLDATLASDTASGLAVLHLVFSKDGQKTEHRQWSNEPGDIYLDTNGQRGYSRGLKEEMKAMEGLLATTGGGAGLLPAFTPKLLLTRTGIATSFSIRGDSAPGWVEEVKGAKLGRVTDKTVVFLTKDSGELTVGKESGQVSRQFVTGESGEKRVLEEVSYRKNPGQEAILALTKDWQTAGALPMDDDMRNGMRASFFQDVIRLAERGELTLEQLKERVEGRTDALDDFVRLCLAGNPNSRFEKMDWEEIAKQFKAGMGKLWKERSGAGEDKEKEFDELWAQHRKRALQGFLKGMMEQENARESALEGIFGSGVDLEASTNEGKEIRDFIEMALSGAYLKEVVRQKLEPFMEKAEKAE